MGRSLEQRRARAAFRRRLGFTMLEIMTSVTLSLMLMYAVARIFSRVGGTMNETTSVMEATNALRNVKNRLTTDLENLTVNPVPPRNSRLNDGYLCYVEGLGASLNRLYSNGYDNIASTFSVDCIALDSERYQTYGVNDDKDFVDSTVGDTDDILSFTARAPQGKPFRGRYIRPKYDSNGKIFSGERDVFESEYAEIVWFLRGTTLYRRVLPILPNEVLQDSLYAFDCAWRGGCNVNGIPNGSDPDNSLMVAFANGEFTADEANYLCNRGLGLFRYYDVSVRLNEDGVPVANTLGDLTNRANRYGYWNPVGRGIVNAPNSKVNGLGGYGPLSIHGMNDAWYWLRMPTLQECCQMSFRAGAPFGKSEYAKEYMSVPGITDAWFGYEQALSLDHDASDDSPLPGGTYNAAQLPVGDVTNPTPFIDFWDSANIWNEVNYETGDLNVVLSDERVFNQDVVLTNVLSFNVKAWDPSVNDYVDLGYDLGDPSCAVANPNDLRSGGYYYNRVKNGAGEYLTNYPMPCVYDTWSEQYQRDLYLFDQANKANNNDYVHLADNDYAISNIALDGEVDASQLKDYPPPYNVPLKSLQIEIRVFDPRSKQLRNQTFVVDLTK